MTLKRQSENNARLDLVSVQLGKLLAAGVQVGRRSRLRDLTKHLATDARDSASAKPLLIYPTREE